jgi:hypothetical protein
MLSFFALLLFVVASIGGADGARAHGRTGADFHGRYFMVVWGYQGADNDVVKSHTFASFYDGDDLAGEKISPATISWLQTTGTINLFDTERGRNFSLAQTLRMACRTSRQVKWWGPYEIKPELYRMALRRIQLLRSGRIAYSMIDSQPRTLNCIDAAGDLTSTPLDTGILWGFAATSAVVRHLSPYFKNNGRVVTGLAQMAIRGRCSRSTELGWSTYKGAP